MQLDYGFEYLGSASRQPITAHTERLMYCMMTAVRSYVGVMCVGPEEYGKFEHVRQLSLSLGRPLYNFNCAPGLSHRQVHGMVRAAASTGKLVLVRAAASIGELVLVCAAAIIGALVLARDAASTVSSCCCEHS